MIEKGGFVMFVDSLGNKRPALITNMFGEPDQHPAINVVIVNDDENQRDSYGLKIERFTSVVHRTNQYANGMYWHEIQYDVDISA